MATANESSDAGWGMGYRLEQRPSRWLKTAELIFGLALAGSAGVWGGRAWSESYSLLYLPGLVSLVCGAVLAVAGVQRVPMRRRLREHPPGELPPRASDSEGGGLPLLGELLVHKYQLITEKDLEVGLEEQRRRGGRLGQVLVAMGLLEQTQLYRVLEDQMRYRDPWRKTAGKAEWEERWQARDELVSSVTGAEGEEGNELQL